MKNLKESLNGKFSHIYVEKDIETHTNTIKILKRFPNAKVIIIDNYKSIFNHNSSYDLQKKSQKLILAKKKDGFIYKGAKMCHDFGFEHFYYNSQILNCLYDCSYCYLQGVYPSAHIVIFVNLEDTFKQLENIKDDIFLTISYDTDLLLFEGITGFVKEWYNFVKDKPNITIELRTKSSSYTFIEKLAPIKNFIIAWNLSPQEIIKKHEINSSFLQSRIRAANILLYKGWSTRLCFDPLIFQNDYQFIYEKFFKEVFEEIDSQKLLDVSIGSFRIGKDYYKNFEKRRPLSPIFEYPFVKYGKNYSYEKDHESEILEFSKKELLKYLPKEKIYEL